LVEVEAATFVSLLVPASTIRKIGYPIKEFFMWADDTEFTQRCATVGPGYVVGKSRVLHLRATPEKIHIAYETDKGRIQNFVFSVRNKVYFLRKKFSGEQGSKLEKYGALVKKYLLDMYELRKSKAYTLLKLIIYHKGFLSGLRFAPSVERPKP
jgi:GT2 family glycosyltransferase